MLIARSLTPVFAKTQQPLDDFLAKNVPVRHFSKETWFTRYIGLDDSAEDYVADILKIDQSFAKEHSQTPYLRVSQLDKNMDPDLLQGYVTQYSNWLLLNHEDLPTVFGLPFPYHFDNEMLELTQKKAFAQVMALFAQITPHVNESMSKNFGVKMFFWMGKYLPRLFAKANGVDHFPKFLYVGPIKQQDFLFLYFLALLGCDVLYMNAQNDAEGVHDKVKNLAQLHRAKGLLPACPNVPDFAISQAPLAEQETKIINIPRIRRIPMEKGTSDALPKRPTGPELNYEALAQLSIAVVMIKVYDETNECIKSGSGVVISAKGYILTNCHVISGGDHFGVYFENDQNEYQTDALIKYHQLNDLALLRVDKQCIPIEVTLDNGVVRGQKVVAIGSPLGLFNTFSDGLVSGFRKFDDLSMIQFTAPISHGSSGGALLDLYGRLVGIITAGFDDGQNLNLAVDLKTIQGFAGGFL